MAHSAALRTFGKHWMKPLVLAALIAPFAYLAVLWIMMLNGLNTPMGWDPVKWTHHYLGDTAIRILLVTLAVSPVRDITGWAPIALVRRRIGLAAFFYAALHMLAYVGLDLGWSLPKLWEDVVVRTYITFGMIALTGDDSAGRHVEQFDDPAPRAQDLGPHPLADLPAGDRRGRAQYPDAEDVVPGAADDTRRNPRGPGRLASRALEPQASEAGGSHGLTCLAVAGVTARR